MEKLHLMYKDIILETDQNFSSITGSSTARKVSVFGVFSRISPYSVRTRENTDQKNFEKGQFSRSVIQHKAS